MMTLIVIALLLLATVLIARIIAKRQEFKPPPPVPAAPVKPPSPGEKKMMGLLTPGDEKVQVPQRDWNALKLAAWRSRTGWVIAVRQAIEIVQRCKHAHGCPGETVETEPCLPACPDREQRMSALVVLNAARQFAPVNARQLVNEPYYAPSRERYSEVLAELAACQAELEVLGMRADAPPNATLPKLQPEPLKIPEYIEEASDEIRTET